MYKNIIFSYLGTTMIAGAMIKYVKEKESINQIVPQLYNTLDEVTVKKTWDGCSLTDSALKGSNLRY